MNSRPLLIISAFAAIVPLIIGSLIFWTWFFYPLRYIELIGFYATILSIPLGITGLILAAIFKGRNRNNWSARRKANRNILLILLNIPICIFYVWFVSYLVDTERITIINNTESDVTDIRVLGSGDYDVIDKIEKGASCTIWVHMTCEGDIKMLFKRNGEDHLISLLGYAGPALGGHRLTRHIIPTAEENY